MLRIENLYPIFLQNIPHPRVTIHLPKTNILDQEAIKKFAQYRNDILNQLKGVIRHHG